MRVKLVFERWRIDRQSVYYGAAELDLATGVFHGGTTFQGEIELFPHDADMLAAAMSDGCTPTFAIMPAREGEP